MASNYTCSYCSRKFSAYFPKRNLFKVYCSEKCQSEAEGRSNGGGGGAAAGAGASDGGSSAAAEAGAAAASYFIEKAGEAKLERAKADAERAKVDTMKAKRDLALQALEIPEDGDELKRVFFSLASQVDFENQHWYSKSVIAKMGGFVPAWKANHSGRPDFAVVLGLLEEEIKKAEAAQVAHDKGESRAILLYGGGMVLLAIGWVGGLFGLFKFWEWKELQAATISESLVGTYERQGEDGETVVLTVNSTSIGVRRDGKDGISFATKSCSNADKSDSMWRGCLDYPVDSTDCEGTLELHGTTLSVALTNMCLTLSGDWKRR